MFSRKQDHSSPLVGLDALYRVAVLERAVATVRSYVNKLVDDGQVVVVRDDLKRDGRRGSAAMCV